MNAAGSGKIIILGMMTKIPVAGVVWQTLQYLIGFERLGYDVYYVEQHGRTPDDFMDHPNDDGTVKAAAYIARIMDRFDLGDRWAYTALHGDGSQFGKSQAELSRIFSSADLIINLHGGTVPLAQHRATDRLIYLETDPVDLQIKLLDGHPGAIDLVEQHVARFSFGENLGGEGCRLPLSDGFHFFPTRQPVVLDFWTPTARVPRNVFTTIGNWEQPWRDVILNGEAYTWSKHHEFLKFIDLPARTDVEFELALGLCTNEARDRLERSGWKVRPASALSSDLDAYRAYISSSCGEFTVAKDQNVRLRTGWFSDRSASYLAAGRPVVTQETGFSDFLPVGDGLFSFLDMDGILSAIETIQSNYDYQSRAAREVARAYFSSEVVLGRLLSDVGLSPRLGRQGRGQNAAPALGTPSPVHAAPAKRGAAS